MSEALLVVGLATWQAVEIAHHGELFAELRARLELWPADGWRGFVSYLILCPFCLSPWMALLGWILYCVPGLRLLVLALAAARLANLGNDLTRSWCRTPRDSFAKEGHEEKEDHQAEDSTPVAAH